MGVENKLRDRYRGDWTRTSDFMLPKHARYQLRYAPTGYWENPKALILRSRPSSYKRFFSSLLFFSCDCRLTEIQNCRILVPHRRSPMHMHVKWPLTLGEIGLSTASTAGTGGEFKQEYADFQVNEIPITQCSGHGAHLYLQIEKIDWTTLDLVQHVSTSLKIPAAEIGYAGLKDKHGITTQWFSIPKRPESALASIAAPGLRVIEVRQHHEKLRLGQLLGNEFTLTIRNMVSPGRLPHLVKTLEQGGFINFFGLQRFSSGRNISQGLKLLRGEPIKGYYKQPATRRLLISAIQSWVFHHWAFVRYTAFGDDLLDGDHFEEVYYPDGNCRTVVTGPIIGSRFPEPKGKVPLALERWVAATCGINPNHFRRFGPIGGGSRRPFRSYPKIESVQLLENTGTIRVFLPKGSYASTFLAEIIKPDREESLAPSSHREAHEDPDV